MKKILSEVEVYECMHCKKLFFTEYECKQHERICLIEQERERREAEIDKRIDRIREYTSEIIVNDKHMLTVIYFEDVDDIKLFETLEDCEYLIPSKAIEEFKYPNFFIIVKTIDNTGTIYNTIIPYSDFITKLKDIKNRIYNKMYQ